MFCPNCNAKTTVVKTATNDEIKYVFRKRFCKKCRLVFYTRETVGEYKYLYNDVIYRNKMK